MARTNSPASVDTDATDTVSVPAADVAPEMTPAELAAWAASPEGIAAAAEFDSEYETGSILDIANRAGYDTSKPFGGLGDTEEAAFAELSRRSQEVMADSVASLTQEQREELLEKWAAANAAEDAEDALDAAIALLETRPGVLDGETITEARDRWYTVVEYSEAFSDALVEFAKEHNTSKANLGRIALAAHIGFTLEPEWANKTSGGGVKKYATKDDAKAALKVQAKVRATRQKLGNAVVELQQRGRTNTPAYTEALAALQAFLKDHPYKD